MRSNTHPLQPRACTWVGAHTHTLKHVPVITNAHEKKPRVSVLHQWVEKLSQQPPQYLTSHYIDYCHQHIHSSIPSPHLTCPTLSHFAPVLHVLADNTLYCEEAILPLPAFLRLVVCVCVSSWANEWPHLKGPTDLFSLSLSLSTFPVLKSDNKKVGRGMVCDCANNVWSH